MAAASAGGRGGGGAKVAVAEQIAQAVQSTSNLLQLMEQSSPAQHAPLPDSRMFISLCDLLLCSRVIMPSCLEVTSIEFLNLVFGVFISCGSSCQVHLAKLPKNLMAKSSLAKNTEQVLHQLPHIISSLDAYMESSLQSGSQIKTVNQVLSNMESTQLRSILPSS